MVLYLLPFLFFLVKYLSVFILLLYLESVLFNLDTCAAFILYSKVSNLQDWYIRKGAFDTDLLIYRGKSPNTLLCVLQTSSFLHYGGNYHI